MAASAQSLVEQIQRIQQQISDGNTSRMGFLTTVRDKLTNIKTKVQDKIAQLQQTDVDAGQVKTELAAKTAEITTLQGEAQSLREEKNGLEEQLKLKQEEFEALQSGNSQKLADLQQREQQLTAEIQQKEDAIKAEQAKKQLSSVASAAALQVQKQQLEVDRNNAIKETEQARQDIVAVQTQLGELRTELETVKQELNAVKQERDTVVEERNALAAELQQLKDERTKLQDQLAAIAQALQDAAQNEGPMQIEILQLLQDIDTALTTSAAPPPEPANTSTVIIGAPPGTVQTEVERINEKTSGLSSPKQGTNTAPQLTGEETGNETVAGDENANKTQEKQGTIDQRINVLNNWMRKTFKPGFTVLLKNGKTESVNIPNNVVKALGDDRGKQFKKRLFQEASKMSAKDFQDDKDKNGMQDFVDLVNDTLAPFNEEMQKTLDANNQPTIGGRRRTRKVRRHRKRRTARKQRGGFMYSKTSRRPSLSSRRSRRSASRRRTPF